MSYSAGGCKVVMAHDVICQTKCGQPAWSSCQLFNPQSLHLISSYLRNLLERKYRLPIPNVKIHKILVKFTKYWQNSQNIDKKFTKYWQNAQNLGNIHKVLAILTKYWQNSRNIGFGKKSTAKNMLFAVILWRI
jgi:hypothetical protein